MSLLYIILILIVIGILLGLVNRIPMASSIKTIINLVVLIAVVVWLLQVFHLLDLIKNVKV